MRDRGPSLALTCGLSLPPLDLSRHFLGQSGASLLAAGKRRQHALQSDNRNPMTSSLVSQFIPDILEPLSVAEYDQVTRIGILDTNGKFCRECRKSIWRLADTKSIRILARMNLSTTQKRRCAGCKILKSCLEGFAVREGCKDIVRNRGSKHGREMEEHIEELRKLCSN